MPAPGNNEDDNLWSRVLDEVQSRSSNSFPQASVLVLGDNECGKTTLIARLRNNTEPKKGAGLEYHYLDVNPDYKDGTYAYQLGSAVPDVGPGESARLGVWILDGDPVHSSLVRHALQSAQLDKCVLMLCASMTQPWSLLSSLKTWAKILDDFMDRSDFKKDQLRDARERQTRWWQEYLEPLDSSTHSESGKVPSMETDSSHILLPLGETTLTHNLGLPVIVVITKCDYVPTLEKEFDFKDEYFDFIQLHLRQFCLNYGAALVYTSVKEGRNCDLLYKYLLHRVYGFPFTHPALVVEKDAVFIPAGWDNEKKISILNENLVSVKPDDLYSDVIHKPSVRRPAVRDSDTSAEDEQSFLGRQLQVLNTQAPPAAAAAPATPSRADITPNSPILAGLNKTTNTSTVLNTSGQGMAKKPESAKIANNTTAANEGVLANFFNTLLTKKTGATPTSTPLKAGEKSLHTAEAAAELERMIKNSPVRPPSETNGT